MTSTAEPVTDAEQSAPVTGGRTSGGRARGRRSDGPVQGPSRGGPGAGRRSPVGSRAPLVLLAPAALLLLALVVYPLVRLVVISFQDYGLRAIFTGQAGFTGLTNYTDVLTDASFWPVILRTVLVTGAMVLGTIVIGMGVAQLLTRLGVAMRTVVSVVLVLAWAMPNVASSLVWQWLFQPFYGVLNWLITQLRVFGDHTQDNWASHPGQAYTIVLTLVIWQAVPFVALTLYAAQSQIAPEYYEAGALDGASVWTMYRAITLPALAPTLLLVSILSVIWDFNVFNQIWLLTRGGPEEATLTLGIWTFVQSFVSNAYGQGAAIAVISTLILGVLTSYYIRRLVRSGEEDL
ncbi:sugar ABC transporter permease [Curtobacterium flaccumfaciens pv. flaccumfaciens]|uniref:carbohydrate ABC transporter permease n=1 Tax=Curtobacterium flaccumfaciens TaxID=2035 RepID=UPI00217ECE36|nr:sugar ABC transporter permease [Curtobacterium flaccumfaciens]MCS6548001.1 sugar ABC transporter permease [Curtobacterium flaccumfaciens pv. flaccumfaciens]